MQVILYKLLNDLRYAKGKLLLMLLAAILSVWGISSVVYSHQMANRDFQVNFAQTFPADIVILVKNYKEGIEEKLLAGPQITDIERREVLGGKIRNGVGEWMPFVLFGVEDMQKMRLDVFRTIEMDTTLSDRVLIEQNARFFLDKSQDSIEVQFPQSEPIKWKIGGTSHDARLAPARMERVVFAHATTIELLLPFLKEKQHRLLIETNVSSDRKKLEEVAKRLKTFGKEMGSPITILSIPTPNEHMHQNIVDGISFLQRSMGGIIAVMGIVLLSLILLTWIFPQVSDIGIMKAIGASTTHLFYSYLIVFALLLLVGLLIGIPLGYKTAMFYNGVVAYIQNFEPVKELLPFSVHLMVLLMSISIPLLFAIIPLSKAAKTSVHEAIHKTFYLPAKGIFMIAQKAIVPTNFKYALNNLFRNSQRSFLLIALTAVGIALFFASANLEHSVKTELANFAETATYQLRVRFSTPQTKENLSFLYQLPFVESISPMTDQTVSYQSPNEAYVETKSARILGKDHIIHPDFVLKGVVDRNCSNCLYISGENMRQAFEKVALGETIALIDSAGETKNYVFSGIFKDMAAIGSPFFMIDEAAVSSSFNALAFEIKSGYDALTVSNAVDDVLLENGIDMAGLLDVNMRLSNLQGHLEPTYLIIKITGLLTIFIGFLGLLIVLNLTIQERTREIGIMKSLGSSVAKISTLFQIEFLIAYLIAILLGILLAIPLTSALCKVLGETIIYHVIPFKHDFSIIILTTFLVIFLQFVLIAVYNRVKIRQRARVLLDYY